MTQTKLQTTRRAGAALAALSLATLLSACASAPADQVSRAGEDPYEASNRQIHEFNKKLDKAVLRPVGVTVSKVLPVEAATLIGNFGENLSTPRYVVNNVLQAHFGEAALNTARFVMNTTIGIGGLIDAATIFGLPKYDTDFGETLYTWGVPEGDYQELPVLGPSTQRRTLGRIVDLALDPLEYVLPTPEKSYGTYARVTSTVDERGRQAGAVDSVLYDSADSYTQLKSIYLQHRRYKLGDTGSTGAGLGEDPYGAADPYADPYGSNEAAASASADPYDASYTDPYDQ
ncbi:VacJ family lipoprotein [Pseudooceanicola sp. CBS1P-1]|uniref:VacJ family lipoprotein n=1 Tax=Pseudooceanicola albus TaxID=2692189 RepID=A0A6L7G749_9RHOB|nr:MULTISPECIES: VacJ family lipoprotein [Pseudooceanicola]MBT9384132.1 VacJ family lipoprotein [Pseudooceanicola endophyticus]MXN19769.1 VacJ family lipoprotein [Pseudooceanicola albus]